ncbi:MAG: sulfatase [Azospira oryzae]|nr:MAG: sulfatase [Azospira oryzae]
MKMSFLQRIRSHRTGLLVLVLALLIGISTLTRIAFLIVSASGLDFTVLNLLGIFVLGFFYDLVNGVYFILPFVLYLWLIPSRVFAKSWHRYILYGWFFLFTFGLLFNAVAEWFFWDEFSGRFNFIAVDYLVYTTEVIGNIRQSYPIEWIIAVLVVLAAGSVYLIRPYIKASATLTSSFKQRSKYVVAYAATFVVCFFLINSKGHRFSTNTYANELAGNGLYELFAAYLNNELDYEQFYKGMNHARAIEKLHQLIQTPETKFTNSDELHLERQIIHNGEEKKLNVVMISVESFSADFMKLFGNTENITPFLDSLSTHSLAFTNLYATGTRTVRGLEALSLSVPPTPGQSIVRRPKNEHLFSWGKVFRDKGYKTQYIYGGYGYFDNMSYFFSNNSYDVVDRSALKDEEIAYENIWGVADENLFDLALRELNTNTRQGPVFAHVMTTSNHRPFTYPDGRIDIPSHTSRQGAVKYTDYAIGRFIKQASREPWFNSTVFIIVADHCASSAGKTDLPVSKYHIPMLIYSPAHVTPGVMDRLMSQIDIEPTVLGMLNFSYTSKFYGYDMFQLEPGRERAFISTYQNLGYIKGNKLVILSPQMKVGTFAIAPGQEQAALPLDNELIDEAIAWYQTASYSFKKGLMK